MDLIKYYDSLFINIYILLNGLTKSIIYIYIYIYNNNNQSWLKSLDE